MRYYQQILRENETLLLAARLHWIVFAKATAFLLAAVLLLLIGLSWHPGSLPRLGFTYGGGLCLLLSPIYALIAWMRWISTDIAVTDRRVIYKRGLISRRSIEMNVSKIETVDVEQGPLARILNYGDIVIRGTGGTFEPLRKVATPLALRNAILVG